MMLDTVNFSITQADIEGVVDFLNEIPQHLNADTISTHNYRGENVVTGNIDNLKVSVSRWQVRVGNGSLCKYLFGDNFQTMGRAEIKDAVGKISDSLHIPVESATITRLDIAENIVVRHAPQVYINHLGDLAHAKRLLNPSGLYFTGRAKTLCFYDKIREQKDRGEPIPEVFDSCNVLRYEQRYMGRLGEVFKTDSVKASTLYDERFYIGLLNRWRDDYRAIRKINDITPNFQYMKSKKDFDLLGRLSYIEQIGGEVAMIEQITEAQKRGELTAKQAFDLRQAVKDTCKVRENFIVKSEVITELDKKIAEAVRFYR